MSQLEATTSRSLLQQRAPSAVDQVGQRLLSISHADRAALWMIDRGEVRCAWSQGLPPSAVDAETRAIRQLLREVAEANHAPIVFRSAEAEGPAAAPGRAQALYQSAAFWPLTYGGNLFGIAGCYHRTLRGAEAVWGKSLATYMQEAASSLYHTLEHHRSERRVAQYRDLSRLNAALAEIEDSETIALTTLDTAIDMLEGHGGMLLLTGPDKSALHVVAGRGPAASWVGRSWPASQGLPWRCLITGRPYMIRDGDMNPPAVQIRLGTGTSLWAPVRAVQEPLGVLALSLGTLAPGGRETLDVLADLALLAGNALRRARLRAALERAQYQTVLALATAVNARDQYTGDHSRRLAPWAQATAERMGCSAAVTEDVRWGALLHDIGKIAVPDPILLKPGPLTPAEWDIVRQHPQKGEEIVRSVEALGNTARLIRHHQERFDGKGYPDPLKGESIPIGARILAVVDAYGAIRDERPYKQARSHAEAVGELRHHKGTQFDPLVVETFVQVVETNGRPLPPGDPLS